MVVRDPGVDVPAEENGFAGSVEGLADAIEAYARLGIDHLIVLLQTDDRAVARSVGGCARATPRSRGPLLARGGCGTCLDDPEKGSVGDAGERSLVPRFQPRHGRATPGRHRVPENALGRLGHAPGPRLRPDPEAFVPSCPHQVTSLPVARRGFARACVPGGKPRSGLPIPRDGSVKRLRARLRRRRGRRPRRSGAPPGPQGARAPMSRPRGLPLQPGHVSPRG